VNVTSGTAILSGSLVGSGGLRKTGTGVLSLTNYNFYTGSTVVAEGTLRLSHTYALPGGIDATGGWDNLNIAGGIVEFGSYSTIFSRPLGTGSGQVQFTGSGGFSAYGNDIAVNLGGASDAVTWGSGSFVPNGAALILSSTGATGTIDFQNPINLGNAVRTFQIENGSSDVDAKISNIVGGNGGLRKTGEGTLELTNANTYHNETQLVAGVLRLSHPNALPGGLGATGGLSNLNLNGGALEWTGDLLRGLGTGPSQLQFAGSCILRPLGTSCIINFGGASQTVYWNSGGFIPDGIAFILDTTHAAIEFQNPINLNNSSPIIEVVGDSVLNSVKLKGTISGNGGLIKTGLGTLELAAANSYSGETKVFSGVLRLSHTNALPGGCGATGGTSNLNIDGGIIELAAGDFFRPLGTGPNQVQLHSGAFVAQGANRIVNFGGASSQVIWGSASFLDTNENLVLSSSNSNATLDFQNPIDLGSSGRVVNVAHGSAMVDAKLSGSISGSGSLEKAGSGVLELTAANTYNGYTDVWEGVLRLSHSHAIPGGIGTTGGTSNLILNGGVIELASDNFSRSIGTGPDQVQLTSGSGFSAAGADRIVNFGGASAPFTLGYYSSMMELRLSSPSADAMVDVQNPIVLQYYYWWNGPSVWVDNGLAPVDAKLSGGVSGECSFTKSGEGNLELTAASTYTGNTYIYGGVLRLSHPQAIPGGIGATGGTSTIYLYGGVLELASNNFYRSLGSGADQLYFNSYSSGGVGGGFSAYGANRIVNFGGASAAITWDYYSFVGHNDLILCSTSANATLDFQNPIILNDSFNHSVSVENGSAAVDAKLSGVLSGYGSFEKKGAGTLVFAAPNTYSGQTMVSGGVLEFDAGIGDGGTQYIDVQSGKVIFNNVSIDNASLTINTAADAMFQIASGTHVVGIIQGDGTTEVDARASLTATSIWQNTLTIASGGTIVIQAISGGPLSDLVQPVPEPSIWILLLFALLGTLLIKRRHISNLFF
jgi:autotransporter-associated beta strand protein